ncbi:MAG: DUF2723 domain-containing protein, partial [Melioribacteraceae bacterium]|nr:DUF2723 domain-containing protein [Melioribacteraceae bacterium]
MKIFEKYYAEFASLIIFAVYLLTLAPSVTQIDSGELAAVQAIGGIAHPTGYPLFTIIGFLWVNLPLPFSKIFLSNLLSAIFVAASVTFFIKSSYLIINNYSLITAKTSKSKRKGRKEILETKIDNRTAILASVFGGFILAFSKSFWIQATSVEVYSLHLLLLKLIIYLLLKVYFMPDNESNLKGWLYTAFALALGFTNHMTTLLILPGFAWLYFNRNKFDNNSLLQIGKMLLVFVPVLILFYSYLPIRASS